MQQYNTNRIHPSSPDTYRSQSCTTHALTGLKVSLKNSLVRPQSRLLSA